MKSNRKFKLKILNLNYKQKALKKITNETKHCSLALNATLT